MSPNCRSRSTSATRSPASCSATARFVDGERLARAALGAEDDDQPRRAPSRPARARRALRASAFWIVNLTSSRGCGSIRMSSAPGLEHASHEAVRGPLAEHEHGPVLVLADGALDQVEHPIRIALAGDDEHVAVGALESPGGRVHALDDADDVDVRILRQRAEDLVVGQAGVEDDEGADGARHVMPRPAARRVALLPGASCSPSRFASRLHCGIASAALSAAPSCYRR